MLKSYIKTALRNIARNKLYAGISILSLAIGLAICLLALQYIVYEFSFDNIKDSNRVYEVVFRMKSPSGSHGLMLGTSVSPLQAAGPPGLVSMMKSYFTAIESGVTIRPLTIDLPVHGRPSLSVKFWAATPDFFKVLEFKLLQGDISTCLQAPNSIVLTRNLALKYFGTSDVLGRTITVQIPYQGTYQCLVTGVMEDFPQNSSFSADAIGSGEVIPWIKKDREQSPSWSSISFDICQFIKLKRGVDPTALTKSMPAFAKSTGGYPEMALPVLIPLKDVHFRTDIDYPYPEFSTYETKYLYILSGVALLVMVVSTFNFLGINLTLFSRRLKEVGIRRVVGAKGTDLTVQFLAETSFLTMVAFAIAVCLAEIFLPLFDSMMQVTLDPGFLIEPLSLGLIVGLALILNMVMSLYRVRFLTMSKPQILIKGRVAEFYLGLTGRQALIGFQFAIGAFLICCALIMVDQLNFVRHKDLGFSPDNVLVIPSESVGTNTGIESVIETELRENPNIVDAASTFWVPGHNEQRYINAFTGSSEGNSRPVTVYETAVDASFLPTLGLRLVKGRNFNPRFGSDSTAVIVNQEAVRELTQSGASGDTVQFVRQKLRVIGVVEDFNYQSLKHNVEPLVMQYGTDLPTLVLKIRQGSEERVVADLRKIWKKVNPGHQLDYFFLDDTIRRLYSDEDRLFSALLLGSVLAIFISLMGVFALSYFLVETKTKEIAVRKLLGSSPSGIVRLLASDLLKMVAAANVFAWPFAYLVMRSWLQNYAYHIGIGLFIFPVVGVVASSLALAAVIVITLKAATANPVESLRYE